MPNWIKFLGTAGARFVVARQLRSSGGAWLHLCDREIFLDPGPGALVRCVSVRPKLNPESLDAIILSHAHIDHSNDINVMIEAMTNGGHKRRGVLYTTHDALANDPVVRQYLRDWVERIEVFEAGGKYMVGNLAFSTPLRHLHPVETYGLKFDLGPDSGPVRTVSFVIDTAYFDDLVEAYRADVLVINVVRLEPVEGLQHLCLADARRLIEAIRPQRAVLTHFGMTMVRAKPWEIAERMSQEIGLEVIAAADGKTVTF